MYFYVLVQLGGVCWGLGGCVGDWEGDGVFFGGSEVLLKLLTFSRLKSNRHSHAVFADKNWD